MHTRALEPHATDKATQGAITLMRAAFPRYPGRMFSINVTDAPIDVRSYWDGGSKDSYVFIGLDSNLTRSVPAQSAFDPTIPGAAAVALPDGIGCVRHAISCGKDLGLTLILHPRNCAPLLPPAQDVSADEGIVLTYTRQLKNTYSGRTNLRYIEAHEATGITEERWQAARDRCISRKLLNRAGSITPSGRNAVPSS